MKHIMSAAIIVLALVLVGRAQSSVAGKWQGETSSGTLLELELTVKDNGRGISLDFLPHVFERFRQQDASPTRSAFGLGLGLSIAKHLVELHGGTITAHSGGERTGSTFVVRMPVPARHGLRDATISPRRPRRVMRLRHRRHHRDAGGTDGGSALGWRSRVSDAKWEKEARRARRRSAAQHK
jgi:hypothetical protein